MNGFGRLTHLSSIRSILIHRSYPWPYVSIQWELSSRISNGKLEITGKLFTAGYRETNTILCYVQIWNDTSVKYNEHIWHEGKVPSEQSTSPLLSRSVSGRAMASPFTSEMSRINLTGGLVHSEILQGITFVRCNLIIVASFKNKYTFLMPAGKSKGRNHTWLFTYFHNIWGGGYARLHES